MDEPPLLVPHQGPSWTPPQPCAERIVRFRRGAYLASVLSLAVVLLLCASNYGPTDRNPIAASSLLLRARHVSADGRRRELAATAADGTVGALAGEDIDSTSAGYVGCDESCCSDLLPVEFHSGVPRIRHLQTNGETDGGGGGGGTTNNNGTDPGCPEEPPSVTSSLPIAVTWILVVFLVCMSALFSGLTLGLMGLDVTGLEIVMEGDDPDLSLAAKKIYPVRKDGNRLLCTLLLGNVAVNALLSILMADIAGGLAGFLVSTAVIVIFGEILPQALCSRYALQIGSRTVPIIKIIMLLMWPLAFPLGWTLDRMLGHELGTTYSKAEMTKLLEIHVKEGRFNAETGTAMTGALKYQDVKVREVMTELGNTYMLSADAKLGYDTISEIFKTGYSRIPVYEISRNNVIGLLFTKDLIFIDPEDETQVRSFVDIFGRGLHVVWPDDILGDVLRDLKQGHSHMALVRDVNNDDDDADPFYEIRGIITLEDIIEVILGDDIVDETDVFGDAAHSVKVERVANDNFDWARLRLLDAKLVDETLPVEEVKAVTAHLRTNYSDAVRLLSDRQLRRLVSETPVTELQAAEQEVGEDLPKDLLYDKGVPADVCTLLLGGKVTVLAGTDNFRADVSSWSVLAPNALTDPKFAPDFYAYVSSGPCRCLRFSRSAFNAAVDASAAEKFGHGGGGSSSPSSAAVVVVPPGTGTAPAAAAAAAGVTGAVVGTGTVVGGGGGSSSSQQRSQSPQPQPQQPQTPGHPEEQRTPNHSVTVDMDKKDVVIGLPENDVVIDVEDFDKVKITNGPAAEAGEIPGGVVSVSAGGGGDETNFATPSSRVTFRVVETQETSASQRTDADAASDVAEEAVAKRESTRILKRRHRSKLLAAFLKKKSSSSAGDAAKEESGGSGEKKDRASSKAADEESNSGEKEPYPSAAHAASSQSAASSSPKAPLDAHMMSPLQAKLTDGGNYAPKPRNVSQVTGSSSASTSTRNRSGSFNYIESSARNASPDEAQ